MDVIYQVLTCQPIYRLSDTFSWINHQSVSIQTNKFLTLYQNFQTITKSLCKVLRSMISNETESLWYSFYGLNNGLNYEIKFGFESNTKHEFKPIIPYIAYYSQIFKESWNKNHIIIQEDISNDLTSSSLNKYLLFPKLKEISKHLMILEWYQKQSIKSKYNLVFNNEIQQNIFNFNFNELCSEVSLLDEASYFIQSKK